MQSNMDVMKGKKFVLESVQIGKRLKTRVWKLLHKVNLYVPER